MMNLAIGPASLAAPGMLLGALSLFALLRRRAAVRVAVEERRLKRERVRPTRP